MSSKLSAFCAARSAVLYGLSLSAALACGGLATVGPIGGPKEATPGEGASTLPYAGSPQAPALQSALDAALRIQNPTLHTTESTDCANCHLAEGARRLAESVYGLSAAKAFTHSRSLAYKNELPAVTNLHAFGYLHRKVSVALAHRSMLHVRRHASANVRDVGADPLR